jgi:hypothetical protein
MAKDFNVYQWRRQHLNENQVSENETSWKEDFKKIMDINNLNQGEVHDFISLYFKDEKGNPLNISMNENSDEELEMLSNGKLKIGTEYDKEKIANTFDQIYWRATDKLDKEGILALPFDTIRYWDMYPPGAYSQLPNFVPPPTKPKTITPAMAAQADQAAQADYNANKGRYRGD